MKELPTWKECSDKVDASRALSPIERFIYDMEPLGTRHEKEFRDGLFEALEEARDAGFQDGAEAMMVY